MSLLLGSRLDPAWTELPLSAGFMPFMDAAAQPARPGRGGHSPSGAPGDPVPLPDLATGVRQGEREWQVEGGGSSVRRTWAPTTSSPDGDTLGAISANLDPRESLLPPRRTIAVRELWKGARVTSLESTRRCWSSPRRAGGSSEARCSGPRCCSASCEVGLASVWRRQR